MQGNLPALIGYVMRPHAAYLFLSDNVMSITYLGATQNLSVELEWG